VPAILDGLLEAVRPGTIGEPASAAVRACVAALPQRARIFQLGLMFGRRPVQPRICVRGLLGPPERCDLLRATRGTGPPAGLESALATLGTPFDEVALSLDATGTGTGLECYVTEDRRSARAARWSAVLERCVRVGLCTARERDGLIAWPGADPVGGSRLVELEARTLHHLKLGARHGESVRLKAYLAVDRLWWVRRGRE
jgi:hypothetical protein